MKNEESVIKISEILHVYYYSGSRSKYHKQEKS